MNILDNKYRVTMPDGSTWEVPVRLIAENRAEYYVKEFGGDIENSLKIGTLPLFEEDDYEIANWAKGNMDWSDVKEYAIQVKSLEDPDFQEGWVNGNYEIVE